MRGEEGKGEWNEKSKDWDKAALGESRAMYLSLVTHSVRHNAQRCTRTAAHAQLRIAVCPTQVHAASAVEPFPPRLRISPSSTGGGCCSGVTQPSAQHEGGAMQGNTAVAVQPEQACNQSQQSLSRKPPKPLPLSRSSTQPLLPATPTVAATVTPVCCLRPDCPRAAAAADAPSL